VKTAAYIRRLRETLTAATAHASNRAGEKQIKMPLTTS
jgi:hypothetical protein